MNKLTKKEDQIMQVIFARVDQNRHIIHNMEAVGEEAKKKKVSRALNNKRVSQAQHDPVNIFLNPHNFLMIEPSDWPAIIREFRVKSPLSSRVKTILFPIIADILCSRRCAC